MIRVALKNALYNKRRLFGTGFSIVIGIAFLAGTFVFTDTINRTFDNLFADVYQNTDVYVRSDSKIELSFGQTIRDRIPESTIRQVAAIPGIHEAVGAVGGYARIIGADGKPVGRANGSPTFGSSVTKSDLLQWTPVGASRFPKGPGEVMLDLGSAKAGKYRIGDTVTVVTKTGEHTFRLVGTVKFGAAESPGGATFAMFDLATAQRFVGVSGQIDAVVASADQGISQRAIAARVQSALGPATEVLTGAEITKESQNALHDALSFITILLLVFAGVALFVGSFIIYNTFSIVVAQTQRENALLRAVGASRVQIVSAILVESVIVGAIASVIGFTTGVALSSVLKRLMAAAGIDIPAGGTVVLPRTVIASIAVGMVMTVIAAVFPSVRASRVGPIAALRDVAIDRSAASRARLVVGIAITLVGAGLLSVGLTGRIKLLAVGVPALFIGLFVLGPTIARPVAGVIGTPLKAVGITGSLARQNSMRNPKRTARTAAALMVGVSLVTGISVLAASTKSSIRSIIGEQFVGDFVVQTDTQGVGGLPETMTEQLNDLPAVDVAAGVQIGYGVVDKKPKPATVVLSVVEPTAAGEVFDLKFVAGRMEALDDRSILLSKDRAASDHLSVGSTVDIAFLDRKPHTLRVAGIYEKDDLAGPYTVSRNLYRRTGADMLQFAVFGRLAPHTDRTAALAAVSSVTRKYPNGKLLTRTSYIKQQSKQLDQFVNLMYGLLALAVVIAVFGIANTLSLSVFERTRELGLLRAVGAYRSQVRAAITWESVITALLGTVQGIVIGILLGYAVIYALRDEGLRDFTIPVPAIGVVVAMSLVAGVVAAIRPARRAARLDVLRALARH